MLPAIAPPPAPKQKKPQKQQQKKRVKKPADSEYVPISIRTMKIAEQRAYDRFFEAQKERASSSDLVFHSQVEKDDFDTLTYPRYSFFSAAGYQAFHLRSCRKLKGLIGIHGYARYNDAIRDGRTPCKLCRPTQKMDILYVFSGTDHERPDDTVKNLKKLCEEQNFPYTVKDEFFYLETPVGKWKIRISSKPYTLFHINLVNAPDNEDDYHQQPRLFMSLQDTFEYIHQHDRKLLIRARGTIDN